MAGGARIPPNPPQHCRYHLDTSYLIPLLLGRNPSEPIGAGGEAVAQVDELARAGRGAAASMIAVGEAFQEIVTQPTVFDSAPGYPAPSQKLVELLRERRLTVCWAGHAGGYGGQQFLDLADGVRAAAPGVGLADILIVTCALACRTTERLYTRDRRLIQNSELRTYCRRRRPAWEIVEAP